jgi:hypothetical protein
MAAHKDASMHGVYRVLMLCGEVSFAYAQTAPFNLAAVPLLLRLLGVRRCCIVVDLIATVQASICTYLHVSCCLHGNLPL